MTPQWVLGLSSSALVGSASECPVWLDRWVQVFSCFFVTCSCHLIKRFILQCDRCCCAWVCCTVPVVAVVATRAKIMPSRFGKVCARASLNCILCGRLEFDWHLLMCYGVNVQAVPWSGRCHSPALGGAAPAAPPSSFERFSAGISSDCTPSYAS